MIKFRCKKKTRRGKRGQGPSYTYRKKEKNTKRCVREVEERNVHSMEEGEQITKDQYRHRKEIRQKMSAIRGEGSRI